MSDVEAGLDAWVEMFADASTEVHSQPGGRQLMADGALTFLQVLGETGESISLLISTHLGEWPGAEPAAAWCDACNQDAGVLRFASYEDGVVTVDTRLVLPILPSYSPLSVFLAGHALGLQRAVHQWWADGGPEAVAAGLAAAGLVAADAIGFPDDDKWITRIRSLVQEEFGGDAFDVAQGAGGPLVPDEQGGLGATVTLRAIEHALPGPALERVLRLEDGPWREIGPGTRELAGAFNRGRVPFSAGSGAWTSTEGDGLIHRLTVPLHIVTSTTEAAPGCDETDWLLRWLLDSAGAELAVADHLLATEFAADSDQDAEEVLTAEDIAFLERMAGAGPEAQPITAAQVPAYCLDYLRRRALQVRDDELTEIEHGFAWYPGPVRQRVTARLVDPPDAVEVVVTTDVWFTDDPNHHALEALRGWGCTSAVTVTDDLVQLTVSMLVYPEIAWWQVRFLAWAAALQVAEARSILDDAAFGLPGGPALRAPTDEEVREDWDCIVDIRDLLRHTSQERAHEVLDPDVLVAATANLEQTSGGIYEVEEVVHREGLKGLWAVRRPWRALPTPEARDALGHLNVVSYVDLDGEHPLMGCGFGIRTFFPTTVEEALLPGLISELSSRYTPYTVRIGNWIQVEGELVVQTFLPAGMLTTDAGASLGNVLSYHERMLYPALEAHVDATGAG